jgi:hypothetical protein
MSPALLHHLRKFYLLFSLKLSDKFGEAIPVGIDDVMVEYCIGGPSLVLCSLEPMLCSSINIGKKTKRKA